MSLQAALALAEEYGIPVFPCRRDTKRPYTAHGFKDASTNLEQIERWWGEHPDALVAVPTGKITKLLGVDVDPDGLDWYRQNAEQLAAGRIHRTRRGFHLLYRYGGDDIGNSAGKLARGVDVRGEGGYIIWWPAAGLHAEGELLDLTGPPQWLLEKLTKKTVNGTTDHGQVTGIVEGRRNDYLSKEAFRLRKQGSTVEQITEVLRALNHRCVPPLGEEEVQQIAQGKERVEPAPSDAPQFERRPIDWRELKDRTPPERDWAVGHWLGMGYTTLLAGAGGLGKTLIAQTFGSCLAIGRGYIDWAPRARRVLMLAGEDDVDELWRRQLAICQWLGVDLDAVADNFICESYTDRDMTLADLVYGKLAPTPFMEELRQQIGDYKAEYVFLDSVARVFGGNENDRHQVTQFCTWLNAACKPTGAGLTLLAHPSRATGSEWSGSTAWEASVRSRLYLATELPGRKSDTSESPEENVRFLSRRKVNYTNLDWRKFTYENGVLVPFETQSRPKTGKVSGEFSQDIVMRAVRKLAQLKLFGCTSTRSERYLPKLAKQYDFLDALDEWQFANGMRELIKTGRLEMQMVGRAANRNRLEGLVEVSADPPPNQAADPDANAVH